MAVRENYSVAESRPHARRRVVGALTLCLLLTVALCLLAGCPEPPKAPDGGGGKVPPGPATPLPPTTQHSLLMVLIDETASFVASGSWDQSITVLQQAVYYLRPRDQICIIGIDHRSGDMDDVRIPVTPLPGGTLNAVTAKKQLTDKITGLKPRETSSGFIGSNGKVRGTPKGSDVEGAIDYAALLAERNSEGMKVRVLVFSDFDQDVSPGTGGATTGTNAFPSGSVFQAFFVVNPEKKEKGDWERRIGAWARWLSTRGLTATAEDFKMPAESLKQDTIRDFMRK